MCKPMNTDVMFNIQEREVVCRYVTEDMKKTLDPAQFGNQKGMGDPALSGRAAG